MSKIKNFINTAALNLKKTVSRFPTVLVFLATITIIVFITIESNYFNENSLLERLLFAGIFGALMSTAVQFMLERHKNLSKYTLLFYCAAFVLSTVYYYFMTDETVSQSMVVHLLVISFALFAAYLYLPSSRNDVDFGNVALAHFKAAFTAILYGVVLFLGFFAIFGAIHVLLYKLDSKIYVHTANIIFSFFTPVYYLSLLPEFNSDDEKAAKKKEASYSYPRVLEILVSNIMIPLISIFSVVLIIYFLKILITGVWPVGQVGPMVLGYSAAGYFIYILCSKLKNRFSVSFRKFFPPVLLPLVAMQLFSSYIRVKAYGITESRYYVILFGVFSIICALVLIFGKKKNPNSIVFLSAIFAILSIIPPVDAFTVSRNSQEARLEEILVRNNMLVQNKIVPSKDISREDKYEITNISDYLKRMGYLSGIEWFPSEYITGYEYYSNFEKIYGFGSNYDRYPPEKETGYVYVRLDDNIEIDVSGYNKFIKLRIINSINRDVTVGTFNIRNQEYIIEQKTDASGNVTLEILNESGSMIIEIPMKDFTDRLFESTDGSKSLKSPDELTIYAQNEAIRIRIIVNDFNASKSDNNLRIDSNLLMFVAVPE